jgi:dTMP kinase
MSNNLKGIFISFEGIDGAGKSTHIQALAEKFKLQGRAVTLTREPGGTELAEKLRDIVLNDSMDALTESLLVFAARRDHINKVILPALRKGEVVLCDRFTDATFAYQGGGRGFDLNILKQLEKWVQSDQQKLVEPDLTLWFALDPLIAAQRLVSARVPDRFESQPVQFFSQVHAAYHQRAEQAPNRFIRIDANQSRDSVWLEILQSVNDKALLRKSL